MRIVLRRRFLMIAAACSVSALQARHAFADLFGGDLPLLSQIVAQTMSTAKGVWDSVSQLEATVKNLQQMGKHLDPRDFFALMGYLEKLSLNLATLTDNIKSMGYEIGSLSDNFDNLYKRDLRWMTSEQLRELEDSWRAEVIASAKVASRAQTSLSILEGIAAETKRVVTLSSSTFRLEGQVQLVVQMLGIVSTQLKFLQQSLDAANRVMTVAAATEASEKQLARERSRRLLENYTYRGKPNIVLQRFP